MTAVARLGIGVFFPFVFSSYSIMVVSQPQCTSLQKKLSTMLNSTVFNEMSKSWHMNALRLPLSNWVYAAHQQLFLQLLDKAVQEANQAGLYVILDLHDYRQGGSPYGSGANMPKPESVTFWKAIATHYLNNTMVLF